MYALHTTVNLNAWYNLISRTEQEDERDRWLIISSLFPSERRREKWLRVLGRKRKNNDYGVTM